MRKILEKVRRNRTYSFGKDLYDRTMRDDVAGLAAQLAYFFLLAIFPGLVFLITLLGFIDLQTESVLDLLEPYVPEDAMNLIEVNVDKVVNEQNGGLLSFGLLSMLWFASNGVNAVMNAFNRAYDVTETRSFIKTRALSILFTLAIIFMIVFALLVPVFGQVIGAEIIGLSDTYSYAWSITRLVSSFFVLFALFSFLYTFAPDRKLKRREVVSGALFATIGWIVVSYSFAYYVDKFANYANTYGGLGGIIVLMLWFYLTGWVILLGGEINGLLHHYRTGDNNSRNEK
ncbi:YihY/virulence factor BrkB family protein [Bacillus cereus]|uniref:YihY/virulence factor BrkB family protein n=1 Tax=Bacillus wiedmannii TaxID=1890302 RepID=A0AA95LW84_9BACI|nr:MULTISPECIES: YihY/virulence factor BrkB family protein [Bacillus]MCU4990619.1 YihY/virulence factor BrkB family protein [Bacillus cereus]USL14092.1 YihY/virulence factor BrkB family protein [Bacillus thuringiensis]WHY29659.1 YihY/virulence factor BrkB family protein [Bacillus wiedmannii]